MPWKETAVREERIRFIAEAVQCRGSMSALCRKYTISRKTGYKWLARYREVGSVADLDELSRRPRSSPRRTAPKTERLVLTLRDETGLGARKIRRMLELEHGVHLAISTVHRILQRHDRIATDSASKKATRRFERADPNALWQMDFKGWYGLKNGGKCHPLSVVDDHSRYAVGLHALSTQYGSEVRQRLESTFDVYGVPKAMLMDHGTPWWGTSNGHGLTSLSVWLIRQDVRLLFGAPGHPQTQGKVERFHKSLKAALAHQGLPPTLEGFARRLASYRKLYNERRPHEALGDEVPASRYRKSLRRYDPNPAPWSYPEGLEVRRLTGAGLLKMAGQQLFVCHALAGRRVGIQPIEEGRILVHYRHMLVREIDQVSGRTMAIVRPDTWRRVLPMS